MDAIKDFLGGLYRQSPVMAIVFIYAAYLILALGTHQYVKGLSKQPDNTPKPVPAIKQNAQDSACSNIVAGKDANVDCPTDKDNHEKKTQPSKR
jgi:hypothetical protein